MKLVSATSFPTAFFCLLLINNVSKMPQEHVKKTKKHSFHWSGSLKEFYYEELALIYMSEKHKTG